MNDSLQQRTGRERSSYFSQLLGEENGILHSGLIPGPNWLLIPSLCRARDAHLSGLIDAVRVAANVAVETGPGRLSEVAIEHPRRWLASPTILSASLAAPSRPPRWEGGAEGWCKRPGQSIPAERDDGHQPGTGPERRDQRRIPWFRHCRWLREGFEKLPGFC